MEEILKLMEERQSSRGPFDSKRPIAREDLKRILEAGRWAPTAHNMQNFEIVAVDDRKLLDAIGNIKRPVSGTFIRENYAQLSFSVEDLRKKKTGLLGTMFPPEWQDPVKIEKAIAKAVASSMAQPLQATPLLIVITYDPAQRAPASEGDFLGIISLGCLLENLWLTAASLGIGVHILSSLSADGIEREVKKILNIPDSLKIAFSMRLGYLATPLKYLRVRREVEDFTHHNRFGNKGI